MTAFFPDRLNPTLENTSAANYPLLQAPADPLAPSILRWVAGPPKKKRRVAAGADTNTARIIKDADGNISLPNSYAVMAQMTTSEEDRVDEYDAATEASRLRGERSMSRLREDVPDRSVSLDDLNLVPDAQSLPETRQIRQAVAQGAPLPLPELVQVVPVDEADQLETVRVTLREDNRALSVALPAARFPVAGLVVQEIAPEAPEDVEMGEAVAPAGSDDTVSIGILVAAALILTVTIIALS